MQNRTKMLFLLQYIMKMLKMSILFAMVQVMMRILGLSMIKCQTMALILPWNTAKMTSQVRMRGLMMILPTTMTNQTNSSIPRGMGKKTKNLVLMHLTMVAQLMVMMMRTNLSITQTMKVVQVMVIKGI